MTGNIYLLYQIKKSEKAVTEDAEDDIDEFPVQIFLKPPQDYLMKFIMGRMVPFCRQSLLN